MLLSYTPILFLAGLAIAYGPSVAGELPAPEYLLAAQSARPAIHIWALHRDVPQFKCALAEPMLSVASSLDGLFCVAGGASGKCYAWDTASGDLLRVWNAHYKGVSALAFLPGDDVLVTGGQDGVVHVWDFSSLIDVAELTDVTRAPSPYTTWTGHSLGVTSVRVCGAALSVSAPVVTASLDRTARVWDVPSRRCLLTVDAPSAVNVAAIDEAGHQLFLGCADGVVYVVDVHAAASAALAPGALLGAPPAATASIAGGGSLLSAYSVAYAASATSAVDVASSAHPSVARAFVGHLGAVVDLGFTAAGDLVTGSADGSVRIWDVRSRSQLRSFDGHRGTSIMALLVLPRPSSLATVDGGVARASRSNQANVAPLKKHAVQLPADWRGSTTGPLDRDVLLALAPLAPALIDGSVGDDGGSTSTIVEDAFIGALHMLHVRCSNSKASGPAAPLEKIAGAAAPAAADGVADVVASLRAQLATLQGENDRWKHVNNALLARMQTGSSAENGAVAAKQQELGTVALDAKRRRPA